MVNATTLASFLYCPRKLFIKKVLLVEEPVKEELIKGTVWHSTHELINKEEEKIVRSIRTKDYTQIVAVYKKEFAKFLRNSIIKHKTELEKFNIQLTDIFNEYWPFFEEEAKEHALNLSKFITTHNIFGEELWSRLTPKILSEQYFRSEKLDLSGIIDVIEIHKVNNDDKEEEIFIPIELKTGKYPAKGMWDGHRIQLAAYILLLEDAGKKVPEAVIQYKDAGEKRILAMNTMLREEVIDLIKKTNAIVNNQNIPEKTDNKNKCISCSFKEVCYNDSEIRRLMEEAELRKDIIK